MYFSATLYYRNTVSWYHVYVHSQSCPNAPAEFNKINPNPVILLLAKHQNSPNPVILLLAMHQNSPNHVIWDYDYLLGLHTHLSIGINFSHSTPSPQTSQSSKSWRATSISSSSSSSAIVSLLSNVAKDGSLGGFLDLDLQR